MQRFLILTALVAYASGNIILSRSALPDDRIVGGKDTTIEEYPFQASLRMNNSLICGCAILSNRMVVTAAHCCIKDWFSWITVQFGDTDRRSNSNVLGVENMTLHPDNDPTTNEFDLCILKLNDTMNFSISVQPIKLTNEEPKAGTICSVSGWGSLSSGGTLPNTLQAVNVTVVDKKSCDNIYSHVGENISKDMMCAGNIGKDSCQGDSGGPLVCDGKLCGTVSWGFGCALLFPGVYQSIAESLDWMNIFL